MSMGENVGKMMPTPEVSIGSQEVELSLDGLEREVTEAIEGQIERYNSEPYELPGIPGTHASNLVSDSNGVISERSQLGSRQYEVAAVLDSVVPRKDGVSWSDEILRRAQSGYTISAQ